MRKLFFLALIVLLSAGGATSQRRQSASRSPNSDHFAIEQGRSFAASPSESELRTVAATAASVASKRIISDISEAFDVIRRNYANPTRLDYNEMTKSLMDSALKSLDPHSGYFDSAEYSGTAL
jgi:C-terminal processing protease CtpA/Prc